MDRCIHTLVVPKARIVRIRYHCIVLRVHFIILASLGLFPSLVPAQPRHDKQRLLLRRHQDQAAEHHVLGSQKQSDHVQPQGQNPLLRQFEMPGQLGCAAAAAEGNLEQRLRGSHVFGWMDGWMDACISFL